MLRGGIFQAIMEPKFEKINKKSYSKIKGQFWKTTVHFCELKSTSGKQKGTSEK